MRETVQNPPRKRIERDITLLNRIEGVANGDQTQMTGLANDVTTFLNNAIQPALSFGVAQLGLSTLPTDLAQTITQVRAYPLGKVSQAISYVADKAKANLGLDGPNADQYQGILGKPYVFTVVAGGEKHRIWLKMNGEGKAVVMRASGPGEFDTKKDVPGFRRRSQNDYRCR